MRLTRLHLSNYRNFRRLELELPAGVSVFVGDNAQGKSNLLEAVYLLATMRAVRAEADSQLVGRGALAGAAAVARVAGEVETAAGVLRLEVAVTVRAGSGGPVATKTVKVNGNPRRLSAAVGCMTAVLFTAEDLELVSGPPALRRRFIDLALGQVDPKYNAARARFERALTQRNHLLKQMREGAAHPDEVVFWDAELARDGGLIFEKRAAFIREVEALAAVLHGSLAPGEALSVQYQPRIDGPAPGPGQAAEAYAAALARGLGRDIAAGMTLQGPHRDDVLLQLDGLPASGFASRAQQRTVALSLRLAEARFLFARRGEAPVLLLDDVLSEMDAARRASVLRAMVDVEQMLVTGTDWDRFSREFLEQAAQFQVAGGSVTPAVPGQAAPRRWDS